MTTKPYLTDTKTTWNVDPAHSDVQFSVRHLMISKVKGHFQIFSGQVTTGPSIEDYSVEAVVNTSSVDTNDNNRDGHLQSPDFFHSETWPEINFRSTRLVDDGKSVKLEGELTIRDVTKTVILDADFGGTAVDGYGQEKSAVEAKTKINRTDFGLTWNTALEKGGVLVSEDVDITLDIQLIKQ